MNVHDSERLAGLLEADGYTAAAPDAGDDVDLLVFDAWTVGKKAGQQAVQQPQDAHSQQPARHADRGRWLLLAQKDTRRDHRTGTVGRRRLSAPTTSVRCPTLLERARHNRVAQVEIAEALQEFPSALPAARESAYAAWVSISVGCNNSCTFCIVPVLAGQGGRPQPERHPG